MRIWAIILILAVLIAAAFWALFHQGDEGRRSAAYIEGNAQGELLTACNRAAEEAGEPTRFTRADVRTITAEAPAGVDLYVTQLEIIRGGLSCHWEGDGAAVLSRNAP